MLRNLKQMALKVATFPPSPTIFKSLQGILFLHIINILLGLDSWGRKSH